MSTRGQRLACTVETPLLPRSCPAPAPAGPAGDKYLVRLVEDADAMLEEMQMGGEPPVLPQSHVLPPLPVLSACLTFCGLAYYAGHSHSVCVVSNQLC